MEPSGTLCRMRHSRHTSSTLLRSVGTEFKVMQELLRHSSLPIYVGCLHAGDLARKTCGASLHCQTPRKSYKTYQTVAWVVGWEFIGKTALTATLHEVMLAENETLRGNRAMVAKPLVAVFGSPNSCP